MRSFLRWLVIGCLLSGGALAENTSLSPTFNGTIASIITGAATGIPLTVTNGTTPLTLTNAGPQTAPLVQEWLFQDNVAGNVAGFQNTNIAGFSATSFRNAIGYEHGAVGLDQSGTARAAAAVGTGSITGTTLTITALTSGLFAPNNTITGSNSDITAGTSIASQATNTGVTFTGVVVGNTLTVSAVAGGAIVDGMGFTGSGVATGTVILATNTDNPILTGTGGNGTYSVYPQQALTSRSMTQQGGPGTYVINNSQTVGSETITANGQDVGTNSDRAFFEASNLNGESAPPLWEVVQTFGNPASQRRMMGFMPNQNFYVDLNSGGNGTAIQVNHKTGYVAISGAVSGMAPQAPLDVYVPSGGPPMAVGRATSGHNLGAYGISGIDMAIISSTPVLGMVSTNRRAFFYLDDANARLGVMDPINGGTVAPVWFYVDGTQRVLVNGALITGGAALTMSSGEVGLTKITASGTAPGATGTKLSVVCGTNSGTAKLIMSAGTSTTAVTVIDNVGSGVTGC